MIKQQTIRNYFLYFIIYAFFGWVYEVLWFIFNGRGFVNRGFLFGPYLPIYGIGSVLLIIMLKKIRTKKIYIGKVNISPLIICLLIAFVTTIVEYIAHYILDKGFGIILWDYSKDYWNINGRVCFAATRNFTIGGMVALYFIQPLIEKMIKKSNKNVLNTITIIIFSIFIIDLLFKIFSIFNLTIL